MSGARSSVHRALWFRHEGPVACVSEHGPTHGRVYLHVLFCDLFLFICISFDLSLVSLKQTLTAVCVNREGRLALIVYIKTFELWQWIELCLIPQIHTKHTAVGARSLVFQVVNANVFNKSCYELMELYSLYFCVFLLLTSRSLPQPLTLIADEILISRLCDTDLSHCFQKETHVESVLSFHVFLKQSHTTLSHLCETVRLELVVYTQRRSS